MIITVCDTEGDGLYDGITKMWCACTRNNKGTSNSYNFSSDGDYDRFINEISNTDILVGHNFLGYDLPVLEKLYGYIHKGRVLDTLVLSRLLNPERVGRHAIEAWGDRFGIPKPTHEDWSKYTPEMLHRCSEDTKINYRLLYELLGEANLTEEDLWKLPTY